MGSLLDAFHPLSPQRAPFFSPAAPAAREESKMPLRRIQVRPLLSQTPELGGAALARADSPDLNPPSLQAETSAPEGSAPPPTYLRAAHSSHHVKKQREGPCLAGPKQERSADSGQHSVDSACRAKKIKKNNPRGSSLSSCSLRATSPTNGTRRGRDGDPPQVTGDHRVLPPVRTSLAVAGPIGNVGGECREARKRGKQLPN